MRHWEYTESASGLSCSAHSCSKRAGVISNACHRKMLSLTAGNTPKHCTVHMWDFPEELGDLHGLTLPKSQLFMKMINHNQMCGYPMFGHVWTNSWPIQNLCPACAWRSGTLAWSFPSSSKQIPRRKSKRTLDRSINSSWSKKWHVITCYMYNA